ncbi:MAG: hypothetical protein QOI98_2295 [Solirubrobacteraceae bacterium]|nr:hypothetical protein [Solirubrobacteraceae bacterium]
MRLAAQLAVARVLAESSTIDEATPRLLAAIGDALGWEVGGLWTVDRADERLRCVHAWHAPGVDAALYEELSASTELRRGVGVLGRVWESGEPRWFADVADEPNYVRAPAARRAGFHSAFCFPVGRGDETLGVVEFLSSDRRPPDHGLLDVMRALGTQIGEFIARRRVEERVRASEALKSAILDSALDCVITMDHAGRILDFSPTAEQTFGYARDDAVGRELAELIIPPALRERHRTGLARYLATGEARILDQRLELTGMRSDGSEFPVEVAIRRIALDGQAMFAGYLRDITERKRAETAQRVLARTSELLAASLDYRSTLAAVARLVVPAFADWCAIDIVEQGRGLSDLAVAHVDPEKVALAERLRRDYPPDAGAPAGLYNVIATGEPELYPEVSDEMLVAGAKDEHHLEVLRGLHMRSVMILPMKATRGTVGTLTLVMAESERRFSDADVALTQELARRAAHAVENARLYAERSRIARTLQDSLLPPHLPTVPGVEVAARYRAAGEGVDVGGDFYDLFDTGRSGWGIVMGDVEGKGADAAALTALARYTLRAAVVQESRGSEVLRLLNDALLRQREGQDGGCCTAVYACLEDSSPDRTLHVASAGHPLPLVLHPDGRVTEAGKPGTLLGAISDPDLHDVTLDLDPGAAVVFYTDGVLDAGSPERFLELSDLTAALSACAGSDAHEIADTVEGLAMERAAGHARDDIAILVIRLAPTPLPKRTLSAARRLRRRRRQQIA